jgi:hypothetical protein
MIQFVCLFAVIVGVMFQVKTLVDVCTPNLSNVVACEHLLVDCLGCWYVRHFQCTCSHRCVTCVFCRTVRQAPGTYWLDNFSKPVAVGVGSIDKGVWRDCLWTGRALKRYSGTEPVDMNFLKVDGVVVPAMPDDLMDYMDDLGVLMKSIEGETPLSYYANSEVVKWDVNLVPLKPVVTKQQDQQLHDLLKAKKDGMVDFFPDEIFKVNVGSNLGLVSLVRKQYDERKMKSDEVKTYTTMLCDINIFDRVLKVSCVTAVQSFGGGALWFSCTHFAVGRMFMFNYITYMYAHQVAYDNSNCGKPYRKSELCILGFWHTYKQMNLMMYKCFAYPFIGALFHHLYPSTIFFEHPKRLGSIVTILSYVRLAYPLFKNDLAQAIQKLKTAEFLNENALNHLLNLRAFVCFFIPAVRACIHHMLRIIFCTTGVGCGCVSIGIQSGQMWLYFSRSTGNITRECLDFL